MTSFAANQIALRLEGVFGRGLRWTSQSGLAAMAWETAAYHLLWSEGGSDSEARRLWDERKGRLAYPVVLVAPAADASTVWVVGPQESRPVRELPVARVLALLEASRGMSAREAASFLAREFNRIEESVVPGVRVKDLLTPHFLRTRLGQGPYARQLSGAVEGLGGDGAGAWRSLFRGLGYQLEELPGRGYLLRRDNAPVAVVHSFDDASKFSRLTQNGELPEGMALADCERQGAAWGILAAPNRYRLFQRRPPAGPATGQYLELDTAELGEGDRRYLGLFAPESLAEEGWLSGWVVESKDFGEGLRKGLEERLRDIALPNIARGLGAFCESRGYELNQEGLKEVGEAALTLVFRLMFLLHTEARGYLPIGSAAYRPHSARQLADDSRPVPYALSPKSTQRWDRLRTLVRMVRRGDRWAGVPAYNGSLFADGGFPGGKLLEEAEIADVYLTPAIAAIAYESDKPDAPGLDYAGLQVGHLGAIYEALLALRLTRATEDLAFDARADVYRPIRSGEEPEVTRADLYYETEAGGRKAGGVFYTRHEFVDHLLNHSLRPALDAHLEGLRELAGRDPAEAARRLFDFSVVDPAMGSAHFLTAALAMIADRIEIFLAEVGGLPKIAEQLSELKAEHGDAAQQPEDGDLLRRLVLKRCIYGVDLSPMAVEVANVTLWLASFVPGLALSYLGSNLKCGDALIGVADPSVVGASDSPLFTGDAVRRAMDRAAQLQQEQAAIPDRTPDEVHRSEELAEQQREATAGLRSAFNLWAAEPLGQQGARYTLETTAEAIVQAGAKLPAEAERAIAEASRVAARYSFFHWPLEFPGVFHRERPGFDVVVGNPPWNEVTVEELAFYALREPGLRGLPNLADRRRRIAELDKQNPEWRVEFDAQRERLAVMRGFFSEKGGYRLQGVGDTDLYQLFCERYSHLVRQDGHLGVVLPRTAFLSEGAKGFRQWLFTYNTILGVDIIRNAKQWAFDITPQYRIALLAAQHKAPGQDYAMRLTGPSESLEQFQMAQDLGIDVAPASLGDSYVVPVTPSQLHADVLAKLRRGVQFDALEKPQSANFVDTS